MLTRSIDSQFLLCRAGSSPKPCWENFIPAYAACPAIPILSAGASHRQHHPDAALVQAPYYILREPQQGHCTLPCPSGMPPQPIRKRESCPCRAKDLVTFLHPELTHPSLSMCLYAVSGPLPCMGLVHEQLLHSVHFRAPTQPQCVLGHNELGMKCGPQRIRMDQWTADLADANRASQVLR